eukprot:2440406-Rhodomonas_salina.3
MVGHAVSEERQHLSYREHRHHHHDDKPQQRREIFKQSDLNVRTEDYSQVDVRPRSGSAGFGRVGSSASSRDRCRSSASSDEEERERLERGRSYSLYEGGDSRAHVHSSSSSGHRKAAQDSSAIIRSDKDLDRQRSRSRDGGSGRTGSAGDQQQDEESSRRLNASKRVGRNRSRSVIEIGADLDRIGMIRDNPTAFHEISRARSGEDRKEPPKHKAIRHSQSEVGMDVANDKSPSDKPERAVKYTFNHDTEEWEGQRVYISLSERPFAQGGCRVCYKMNEVAPQTAWECRVQFAMERHAKESWDRTKNEGQETD